MSQEVQYWRCCNDECGFYVKRKKKYPYNQKSHKWDNKARWLIAKGVIAPPNWMELKCPQCDYKIIVGGSEVNTDEKLDTPKESIIDLFRKVKTNANS